MLQDHLDLSVAPIRAIDRGLNSCRTCPGVLPALLADGEVIAGLPVPSDVDSRGR